jgi:hypothetical protein
VPTIGGPRWLKHLGAPYLRLSGDVWTSLAQFQDSLRLAYALPSLEMIFELSAVQFSGLPGNDRPLTRTVTSRLARSSILARWRHSISSENEAAAFLATRSQQVQHSKYRPSEEYSNRRFG